MRGTKQLPNKCWLYEPPCVLGRWASTLEDAAGLFQTQESMILLSQTQQVFIFSTKETKFEHEFWRQQGEGREGGRVEGKKERGEQVKSSVCTPLKEA